jgi:sarcosine oxidase
MTRVAVVGAGINGLAAAWALAGQGAEVTLHEQFDLDHDRGSSHGRTRIVRLSYPDVAWVRFAEEARAGWAELEEETGRSLLELHGLVEIASEPARTSAEALAAQRVEHKVLTPEEARELGFVVPEGWFALYEPGGGVVRADLARAAFLDAAVARGVQFELGRVESPDDLDADVVVLCAGGWIAKLVPDVPVHVTRETVVYFRKSGPPALSLVELNEESGGHAFYSLHDPLHGLKAGAHHAGAEADPDVLGEPDSAIVERVADWVAERMPEVDPTPVDAQTCLYTTTEDEGFVLERRGRIVIGSACSGHGFKFAPAVGKRLAALALG